METALRMPTYHLYTVKINALHLDADTSSKTLQPHNLQKGPRILVFRNGKLLSEDDMDMILRWAFDNCR